VHGAEQNSLEQGGRIHGSKDGAYILSLDTGQPQLAAINSLMNDVANDTQSYAKGLMSEENAKLLVRPGMGGALDLPQPGS